MRLYIKAELINKSKAQTGETRGGEYAARVRVGTEKDGSPKYKYFKTKSDYKAYIASKREEGDKEGEDAQKDDDKQDLKHKLQSEQRSSKLKQVVSHQRQARVLEEKK